VTSCEFLNNTAQGIFTDLPYRGNGGGLSIGIHNVLGNRVPSYTIRDSTFANNTAISNVTNVTDEQSGAMIIEDQIFNGRGGGVAIVLSQGSPVNITVQTCTFSHNTASSFAGGLYFLPAVPSRGHTYTIEDSTFTSNVASFGGGGLGIGYISDGAPGAINRCYIRNCTLRGNRGDFGGGLYVVPGEERSGQLVT